MSRRPKRPFPYCNEVWTGLEYTAAAGMIYEGLVDEGVKVVAAARARHDGKKRNPFDEPECGHHYARAMAAWGTMLALTGFQFDGRTKEMSFASGRKNLFWSNGDAWGTCKQSGQKVEIAVGHGSVEIRRVNVGSQTADVGKTLSAGDTVSVTLK